MHLLLPWGLTALVSLGGIIFIYLYVFKGKRIRVSALFLWDAGQSFRAEGKTKKRPPLTWPLVLDLLTAIALTLIIAALAWRTVSEQKHMVVVLDSSASMNAESLGSSCRARAIDKIRELSKTLGKDGKISIVRSGLSVELLGGKPLDIKSAESILNKWRPSDPPHSLRPALELARSLAREEEVVVLITDREQAEISGKFITIAVGKPSENIGWIAGNWLQDGSGIFTLVRHFGDKRGKTEVVIEGDGREISKITADFTERDSVPIILEIPEGVQTITAKLPDDSLANDNILRLSRPTRLLLPVSVKINDKLLNTAINTALKAVDGTYPVEETEIPSVIFTDSTPGVKTSGAVIEFRIPPKEKAKMFTGPYIVDPFTAMNALLTGLDLNGVIWPADPDFAEPAGTTLVSVGKLPAVLFTGNRVVLNIRPDMSNLFTSPAWPILVSNIIEYVKAESPGLKRHSYHLGEAFAFKKPLEWPEEITITSPEGIKTKFKGPMISYGRLALDGTYRITDKDNVLASIDANLFSEQESDLTKATESGNISDVKAAMHPDLLSHPLHRELAVAAAALALGCWAILERRKR